MGYTKIHNSVVGLNLALTRLHSRTAEGYYPYHRYSTMALATFGDSRGLTVTYPSGDRQIFFARSSIIKALQRADDAFLEELKRAEAARVEALRSFPFRFLDLAPELRNMVYEELLTIDEGSLICHPQILRTCKEIQGEATSILYAANPFYIEVSEKGILANDIRCGRYVSIPSSVEEHQNDLEDIEWPEFLQRAQSIHINASDPVWLFNENRLDQVPPRRRTAIINNVVHSLCSALRPKHQCRTLNFGSAFGATQDDSVSNSLNAYYPMRLLGVQQAQDLNADMGQEVPLYHHRASREAATIQGRTLAFNPSFACRVSTLCSKIIWASPHAGWLQRLTGSLLWTVARLDAGLNLMGCRGGLKHDEIEPWLGTYIRDLVAEGWVEEDNSELWDEVNHFLQLEVELCTARDGDTMDLEEPVPPRRNQASLLGTIVVGRGHIPTQSHQPGPKR